MNIVFVTVINIIFTCFVDLSKVFDKVNYWKRFHKLLDDNIAASLISILVFWHTNQTAFVRWHDISSARSSVGNCKRQLR